MDRVQLAKRYIKILEEYDPTGTWVDEADERTALADITYYPQCVIEKLLDIIDDVTHPQLLAGERNVL